MFSRKSNKEVKRTPLHKKIHWKSIYYNFTSKVTFQDEFSENFDSEIQHFFYILPFSELIFFSLKVRYSTNRYAISFPYFILDGFIIQYWPHKGDTGDTRNEIDSVPDDIVWKKKAMKNIALQMLIKLFFFNFDILQGPSEREGGGMEGGS